jgi:NAD(P)-dependent dehydrogenase (short-subunit alcohol dehydrogenase family)
MKLQDATVRITGANRGIGLAFAEAALARGAHKVYACARNPSSITTPGLVPVKLDVTSGMDVAAARSCADVTVVVNNAGIGRQGGGFERIGVH